MKDSNPVLFRLAGMFLAGAMIFGGAQPTTRPRDDGCARETGKAREQEGSECRGPLDRELTHRRASSPRDLVELARGARK